MKNEITVFCPATVSNVGPGFDLLGFALETPGDEIRVCRNDNGELRLFNESGIHLPLGLNENVASISAKAMLDDQKINDGFDIIFSKKINPGSGLGSSAASCVAAVVGINEFLQSPLDTAGLLPYAMEGERFASGSYHADNIAPALLGGFTLIRGYNPIDIKHIPYPPDLYCAIVHPELEFKTSEGRKILPSKVSLKTAIAQAGNLGGLIAGLTTADYGLIGRSICDHFAEPYRIKNLPGFEDLRKETTDNGALGTGLSGSGPSIFSLCRGVEMANRIRDIMEKHFSNAGIQFASYTSAVSEAGCRITG